MKDCTQPDSIITLTEAATLIGVSRQGARHIADRDPLFPPPIDTISNGKTFLFWRKGIVAYVAERKRGAEAEAAAASPA